jgi:aspartokinase
VVYLSKSFGECDNLSGEEGDYTASLLGAALNASEIQIWTDINGFHNNDPRYVEKTNVIWDLSFDERSRAAYFGAKILIRQAFNPALKKNIPSGLKIQWIRLMKRTLIHSRQQISLITRRWLQRMAFLSSGSNRTGC